MTTSIPRRCAALAAAALVAATSQADTRYVDVPVVDVEPIVETIVREVPQEHCSERLREVAHREAATPHVPRALGAVIGGAIGHAAGHKKRNKQVGTVVGAVLGAAIGNDIARHEQSRRDLPRTRVVREQVCEISHDIEHRERIAGYLVTYRYAGETHRSRMARHPGEQIRIRVQIAPVAG